MLRKFKIKLNRENLEKNIFYLYKAIMLWDGCTILDLNKIEPVQHLVLWTHLYFGKKQVW
jgi:hypothetical protein